MEESFVSTIVTTKGYESTDRRENIKRENLPTAHSSGEIEENEKCKYKQ